MTTNTSERLADHFVSYLFDEYSGSRHVRRVASWVGFVLKAIEGVAGGSARQNRKRQVVFDYAGHHFKARYDHKIGTRGGIEIEEFGEQRGSPDVGTVVQIASLNGAEEVYRNLQVLLEEYLDIESAGEFQTDDLRPEYPVELIRPGERGKYAKRYREGTNIVLIDPELHRHYPDSETVNRALREHLTRQT